MKKLLIGFLLLLFALLTSSLTEAAELVKIRVNGTVIMPDVAPVVVEGRTLVPVRFVAEALGASVNWDENTSTVVISTGGASYSPPENSTGEIQILVNGQLISPDVPPRSVNGRVMVPIRYVAEALNCRVGWYDHANTVTITDIKLTTEHTNIFPASGVKQETVDIIKKYAEQAYLKVSADLEPLQDTFYDIYLYPDHNSYTDGSVELRRILRDKVGKGTIFWQSPNIIGIDLTNLGPDTGNWMTWAFTTLNAWNIAGNRNKVPKWLIDGLGFYECYSNPQNSLTTKKNLANDRMTALDAVARATVPKFSEAPNPVTFSYTYKYADYMAAKILIDKLGFSGVSELLRSLNSTSDFQSVFPEKTGYNLEVFDYQLHKSFYSDTKQKLKPTPVKVSLTNEGCTNETSIVVATTFSGQTDYYQLKVGKTPGDYYFVINPDGTVSSNSNGLTQNKNVPVKGNLDVVVAVFRPTIDVKHDYFHFKISYGMLYPNQKAVYNDKLDQFIDLTNSLDIAFPDGNKITLDSKNKTEFRGSGVVSMR